MAEDLERLGYYHPTPAHDMWAFGLVLLDLAGGSRSTAHLTACVTKDPEKTRAFARSLLCRAPRLEYYDQVCTAAQTFYACSFAWGGTPCSYPVLHASNCHCLLL